MADAPRSFAFRVNLRADEIWESLTQRGDVRVSDEAAPSPPPPAGAPFLALRSTPTQLQVRRWAGPADAASPVIVVDLEEDATGCAVYGHFERPRAGSLLATRRSSRKYLAPSLALLAAFSVGAAVLGGGWAAIALPLLLVLFAIPAGAVMLPMLMLWNAQSRSGQTESLWALVGEVFTPLALPEDGEPNPFR